MHLAPSHAVGRGFFTGLNHRQAVGRGTVRIRGETLPVSDTYGGAFDRYGSRWK